MNFVRLNELLDSYDSLNKKDSYELYQLVNKFCLFLANKHYKDKQYISWKYDSQEKQRIRIDIFYQYFLENRGIKTVKFITSSFSRRFSWVEMLVNCKHLAINIFDESLPITKQINSAIPRYLILGRKIERRFIEKTGREPNPKEFVKELIRHQLSSGKLCVWSDIKRITNYCLSYFYCRRYSNPFLGYDESF